MKLEGKTAPIISTGSEIGPAIVRLLALEGIQNQTEHAAVVEALGSRGFGLATDVTDANALVVIIAPATALEVPVVVSRGNSHDAFVELAANALHAKQ